MTTPSASEVASQTPIMTSTNLLPPIFNLDDEVDALSLDSTPAPDGEGGAAGPAPVPVDSIPVTAPDPDGPCWHPGCRHASVDPCEFFQCPRWACPLHGIPYIQPGAPFLSLYLCSPCNNGVLAGSILPSRASEPAVATDASLPAAQGSHPPPAAAVFAAPLGTGQAHPLSHIAFHPSHALGYKGGYAWCWKCGSWTSGSRAQKLSADCTLAPSSAAGHDVKDRVARGLTPQRGQEWLVPDTVGPPPGVLVTGPPPPPPPPSLQISLLG